MKVETTDYSIHFETLGCRLNQIESESAAHFFSEVGFRVDMDSILASGKDRNDVFLCVINTCTVTSKAEQKARRLIRLLLKKCPNAAILVTGCYAELDATDICAIDKRVCVIKGSRKDILADLPQPLMHFLTDNSKNYNSGENIARFLETITLSKLQVFTESATASFRLSTDTFLIHSRASIKIQDGCSNSCSYCRIHLARGKSVSLNAESVLERVQLLEKKGQNEVVLTGVNLSQYHGKWKNSFVDLVGLLEILLENTEHIYFRLSSLYPERINEDFCRVIKNPRIQPHFHLSVQSGSNKILSSMKRPYQVQNVLDAVKRLREAKDNPFIACDLIAGFPGETDEDFEQTMDLCYKAKFAWVHAFPFSPRPGTVAYSMKPVVPQAVATQRVKKLSEFAIQSKYDYISLWSGKILFAITESNRSDRALSVKDSLPKSKTHAVTSNFLHVELPCSIPQGKLIKVRLGKPLLEHIQRGDEIEAIAELVLDS